MGIWGTNPWDNDRASDWFDGTFDATGLAAHVEQTLNLDIAKYHAEIRAAAYLLTVLGEKYIWPTDSRDRCLKLAATRLQAILDSGLYENPEFVSKIGREIELLRAES